MEQSTFPELPVSEEPGQSSPTPSCDSIKSDMSKFEPLSFDGNNSPWSEDQGQSSPASSSMMCSTSRSSPISDARRGGVRKTREDTENTPLSPRSKALKKPSEVVGGHKAGLGSILKPQHQVRSLIGLSPAGASDAVDKKHLTTPKARRRRSKSDDRKEKAEIHVKKCKTSGVKSPTTEERSIYWKLKAKALQARVEKLEEENKSLKKQLQEKSAAEPGVRCTNTHFR